MSLYAIIACCQPATLANFAHFSFFTFHFSFVMGVETNEKGKMKKEKLLQ